MTLPLAHIAKMAPYALADLNAPADKPLISMAQNESIRPPTPIAFDAANKVLEDTALYPDPDWSELRSAISAIHGIPPEMILCGAGSMELIASIAHAYLGPEDEVVTSQYAYAFIKTACLFRDAGYKVVPERNRTVAIGALGEAVSDNTKIVFVANPGNPTGTRITSQELRKLRADLDPEFLLVIDEAYGEFCDHLDDRLFDLAQEGNTVILRTFSKAYGLAGMRVGWGCFPPAIGCEVRKLLNPNNVSVVSQAMALAAVEDGDYMSDTCRITAQLRDQFIEDVRGFGLSADASHSNFVLLRFPDEAIAQQANLSLTNEGIMMRPMHGYGLGHCLRATIVNEAEMAFVSRTLGRWSQTELPND